MGEDNFQVKWSVCVNVLRPGCLLSSQALGVEDRLDKMEEGLKAPCLSLSSQWQR